MYETTHGLVNSNDEILEYRRDIDPSTVVTKTGFRWLPLVLTSHPAYNIETQFVVGPTHVVHDEYILQEWTVVNKTPEDIESEKISKIISIDQNVFNVLLLHENKFRELTSGTPLTKQEYILYLKDFF